MRSLIAVASAFLLGLLCPMRAGPVPSAWLGLGCCGLGLVLAAGRGRRVPAWLPRAAPYVLVPAAFLTGLALLRPAREPLRLPPAGLARLSVRIEEVSHLAPGQARSRARVLEGARIEDGVAIAPGTRLSIRPYALPEGATLSVLARVRPSVPFRNPSPHTPLPSARGVHASAQLVAAGSTRVIEHDWPARALWTARSWLRGRLVQTLEPEVANVARALTLGDPDALAEPEQAQLRASGLAHVFAVSGMHVTLLAGGLVLVLARALTFCYPLAARWDARRIAAGLGAPSALLIGAFTGAAPSGMRAAVTSAIAFGLIAAGRRPAPAAVAAFASLLFGALWPEDALRPAYLLSIAATAAILSDRRDAAASLSELVRSAARLSLRTSAATAPLALWSFGTLPLVSVLANLLLAPIGSLLLVLSVVHALLACLFRPAAWLSALPLERASAAFLEGCAWFAALDPQLRWPVLSDLQGAITTCALGWLLFARHKRRLVLVAALLALSAEEWQLRRREQPHGRLRATFVDVGQGDSTLIDLPDGRCMLVDAGGNPNGGLDPGLHALVPLLSARRRSHLDVVVLSHPHPDHYGGLDAVLDAVSVGEVWDSGQARAEAERSGTSRAAQRWLERAARSGARVREPDRLCGQPQVYGGARVDVLWPCPGFDPGFDPNDNSLVLRIAFGAHAFLLAGDAEHHAEASLVPLGARLRADVLKVPHHGSNTSSSAELLRAVSPAIAVVSAGAANTFGHPNPAALERLRNQGARTIELARTGGTIITTDGRMLSIRSWMEE